MENAAKSPFETEEHLSKSLAIDMKKLAKMNPRFNRFSYDNLWDRIKRKQVKLEKIRAA